MEEEIYAEIDRLKIALYEILSKTNLRLLTDNEKEILFKLSNDDTIKRYW